MKVITPGRPQTGWAREETCTGTGNGGGGCGAVLLVEQTDMYQTVSTDYAGGRDEFVTFTCACCGVESDMKSVPSQVVSRLPSKRSFFATNPLGRE